MRRFPSSESYFSDFYFYTTLYIYNVCTVCITIHKIKMVIQQTVRLFLWLLFPHNWDFRTQTFFINQMCVMERVEGSYSYDPCAYNEDKSVILFFLDKQCERFLTIL